MNPLSFLLQIILVSINFFSKLIIKPTKKHNLNLRTARKVGENTLGKRRIYCNHCDSFFFDMGDFASHLERKHAELIPEDMVPWQYGYYIKTGKKNGKCIVCGKPTKWNETTHKYKRFCDNPKCIEKYKETFRNRMIGKYGKTTLLNDPEQQRVMLANRSISNSYLWSDHIHKTVYTGTYELSFLEFLNEVLYFDPTDIIGPSPHTYYYIYNNTRHFYFPDFYIPSLNLEIEIKDGGDNPNMHHKIQDVDKIKEKLKDEVMISNRNTFNYLKITNKNNMRFLDYLERAKMQEINKTAGNIVML